MTRFTTYIMPAIVAASLTGVVQAQTGPDWNRSMEAMTAQPAPGGGHTVTAYFSAASGPISTPLDLSTDVELYINGTLVEVGFEGITADPFESDCGDFGESCAPIEGPCICGILHCGCGWMLASVGLETSLSPGDEIMVILRPSPGAAPEPDQTDDVMVMTYNGDPIGWNRRIDDIAITPAPGAPDSFFCITYEIDIDANYDGPLNLDTEVVLLINGEPVASHFPTFDLVWNQCGVCDGEACVTNAGDPYFCNDNCGCTFTWPGSFDVIPLDPDDDLGIILRPVPGALPELPGFEDDDEIMPCTGDFDGSGIVDAADLLGLLAAWNTNDATYDIAPLGGDGIVNLQDLLALLSNWGHCFPV